MYSLGPLGDMPFSEYHLPGQLNGEGPWAGGRGCMLWMPRLVMETEGDSKAGMERQEWCLFIDQAPLD